MVMSVLLDEQIEISLGIRGLTDFRLWVQTDQFPERGQIDFVGCKIVTGRFASSRQTEDGTCDDAR